MVFLAISKAMGYNGEQYVGVKKIAEEQKKSAKRDESQRKDVNMSASVKSMTGYGRGEHIAEDRKFTVEMKAVNHRYNDITIKLPRSLASLEDKIKKEVMKEVFRGKTDVFINFETFSTDDVEVKLNETLARAYYEKLQSLQRILGKEGENLLEMVAKFPDVITVDKPQGDEAVIWAALQPALYGAVVSFGEMRQREGATLKADMLSKVDKIRILVQLVAERSPIVVEEYKEKLNNRLKELLGGVDVDPQRIATEVAVFADRGCVDEEITRLQSHLEQLAFILKEGGQVGRKLDFLVQEMNRESNTIASKANDIQIVQASIELKSEIEKIREQVQNLE